MTGIGLTADEMLLTTRAVRRRLDFDRPPPPNTSFRRKPESSLRRRRGPTLRA